MKDKIKSQLAKALRKKLLVRFASALDTGTVNGYVLDIGPKFFLLALFWEGMQFNGFQCYRFSDIRKLQVPDKYASFHEAVLKKLGQRIPKKPVVSVTSLEQILLTANRAFPLVTIHRERAARGVCHIGRVVEVSKGRVTLLEIGPDAIWDDQLESYKLSEITRVDFCGRYEDSLYLIGASEFERAVRQIWGPKVRSKARL